jgi:hypothetical protein
MFIVVLMYICDICCYHYLRTYPVYKTTVRCTSRIIITIIIWLTKILHTQQTDYAQSIPVPSTMHLVPVVHYHSHVSKIQIFRNTAMLLYLVLQKYDFNKS